MAKISFVARSLFLACVLLMIFTPGSSSRYWSEICTNTTCRYHLIVSYGYTMVYTDSNGVMYDVRLNGSRFEIDVGSEVREVSPDEFIVGDGVKRRIFTVNGQYPGPPIQVIEGNEVIVLVTNNITEIMTIHFHGMKQLNTWFMDGAGAVTACPIPPGGSFEHRFIADPVGTHWYHEHTRLVYADGMYGLFVVYPRGFVPSTSPDHDDFLVITNDWYHAETTAMYGASSSLCQNGALGASLKEPGRQHGCWVDGTDLLPETFESALFGGRGRYGQAATVPLVEYVVTFDTSRRFRVVNSGFWFPLEVSVDGHKMAIVASDGGELQPVDVDSFYIYLGERIDFVVRANQSANRYWIRARPGCREQRDEARAILAYDSAPTSGDPASSPRQCTANQPCTVFNCPFGRYPDGSNRICITFNDVRSSLSPVQLHNEHGVSEDESNVLTYFLNFAMTVGGSINARRFKFPATPYFEKDPNDCPPEPCVEGCLCRCTHTLKLPFNRTVQFVVSNLQPNDSLMENGANNLHFHGKQFAVMTQRFPQYDSVTGYWTTPNPDVTCGASDLCWNPAWTSGPPSFAAVTQPPIKDTIVIPTRGYEVLRFRTTNPGPFMLHCHLDDHVVEGMAMIIDIGPDVRPPPPIGFQTCGQEASAPRKRKCRKLKGANNRYTCKRSRTRKARRRLAIRRLLLKQRSN